MSIAPERTRPPRNERPAIPTRSRDASEGEESPARNSGEKRRPKKKSLYAKSAAAFRWVHIYVSMLSFAALLFFSFTGITLNHPDWFGGEWAKTEDLAGELPLDFVGIRESGDVESVKKLETAEFLRKEHSLRGSVAEFHVDEFECMVVFKGPGYSADAFVDRETGKYALSETRMGIVAIMNDLHKGRDSGAGWSLAIDVSAIVMIVMALSGFGLLFYLKLKRRSGLVVAALGTVALVAVWLLMVP